MVDEKSWKDVLLLTDAEQGTDKIVPQRRRIVVPDLNERLLFWELLFCEGAAGERCSAIVAGYSEDQVLARFRESPFSNHVTVVEVRIIGIMAAVEALLNRAERR